MKENKERKTLKERVKEKYANCKKWVSEHRKEAITGGTLLVILVGGVIRYFSIESSNDINMDLHEHKGLEVNPLVSSSDNNGDLALDFNKIEEVRVVNIDDVVDDQVCLKETSPFNVDKHIRNLPDGWMPSPEKIATAAENGFDLQPGQTWVDEYTKGGDAA